ncbi:MAG: hypothetical protein ACRDGL_10820 [Candidatus Limnocylindrales bacterium]
MAAAWRSLDGRTWTRATVARPGGLGASIDDIELGAQGMVALGATADSKGGAAWTSADGRTWAPIALSAASGTAAAGAPRLPSGSVVGDGSHLVGVTSDRGALSYWASSDGLAWHSLSLSGATATDPWEAGDPTHPERWIQQVYVVPDGLVVTGQASTALPETVLWRARALP